MKLKIIILTIILTILSGCSFVNEENIKENDNINIDNFIKEQRNTGSINDGKEIDSEAKKFEEEFENLIDILIESSN